MNRIIQTDQALTTVQYKALCDIKEFFPSKLIMVAESSAFEGDLIVEFDDEDIHAFILPNGNIEINDNGLAFKSLLHYLTSYCEAQVSSAACN